MATLGCGGSTLSLLLGFDEGLRTLWCSHNDFGKGATSSARGAKRVVGDALAQLGRMSGAPDRRVLVRADAAYYSHTVARAALAVGADAVGDSSHESIDQARDRDHQ